MSAAGWELATAADRSEDIRLGAAVADLAAEFAGYDFGTCATWDGRALTARRQDPDEPGVCLVITPDPDEMRAVLRADRGAPPDSG